MIAVDTSALMAIVLNEPEADQCSLAMANAERVLISATTLAETLIVAERKNLAGQMATLINGLDFEIVPTGASTAHRVAAAYALWGKGIHPAALNFGDCFAYALAKDYGCPLLYVGQDFAQTDILSALD